MSEMSCAPRREMAVTAANADQAEFWGSDAAAAWTEHQQTFDMLLHEVLEVALTAAAPQRGERVVDIGCGTGASAIRLAEIVGAAGHVTGLDISVPFLELAKRRAKDTKNLTFSLGDAQTHAFPKGEADLVFSRFGVMFFEGPVAAFSNIRRALRPGGRLVMICWAGAPENPWFMEPMQAAMGRLGKAEPMDPHAPGPMAFKDVDRVVGILQRSGWADASGQCLDVPLIPPQTPEAAATFATTAGPATRLLREKNGTPEDLAAIREDCAQRFRQYQSADGLRIPARLILYTARVA